MEILLIVAVVVIIYLAYKNSKMATNIAKPEDEPKDAKNKDTLNLSNKYKKKLLLTKTEYTFYGLLKKKCDEASLLICPKVRLEDFIDVTAEEKMKYRGYIKSRHIDFLICDSKLRIAAAIELDDSSHKSNKAQSADAFKNELYRAIGLPLYRIKTNENYTEKVEKMIQELKNITPETNQ